MRITGPAKSTPSESKKTKKASGSSDGAFASAVENAGQSESAGGGAASAPVAAVDSLLELQAEDDDAQSRSKGLQRAGEMLDLLEEVRRGLLIGAIPKAKLEQLSALARSEREGFTDPRLGELLDEIELRAEVELAKLETGA